MIQILINQIKEDFYKSDISNDIINRKVQFDDLAKQEFYYDEFYKRISYYFIIKRTPSMHMINLTPVYDNSLWVWYSIYGSSGIKTKQKFSLT